MSEVTNSAFARKVNEYWQKRGLDANARTERRTITVPDKISTFGGRPTKVPGYTATLDIIVSDTINGYPTRR